MGRKAGPLSPHLPRRSCDYFSILKTGERRGEAKNQRSLRDFALRFSFLFFEVFINLALRALLRMSVSFLNSPDQLILISLYMLPIIFGEIRPFLFHASNQLLPFPLDYIAIHLKPPRLD